MTVALDANLLLYASDAESPFHARATAVLADRANGPEIVYVFWPVAIAYMRIATHPSIFRRPLTPGEAVDNLDSLLTRPNVRSPGEQEGFWATFRAAGEGLALRGNLVTDGHIVALMRQHEVRTILSRDRDFRRFDGIRAVDPLA